MSRCLGGVNPQPRRIVRRWAAVRRTVVDRSGTGRGPRLVRLGLGAFRADLAHARYPLAGARPPAHRQPATGCIPCGHRAPHAPTQSTRRTGSGPGNLGRGQDGGERDLRLGHHGDVRGGNLGDGGAGPLGHLTLGGRRDHPVLGADDRPTGNRLEQRRDARRGGVGAERDRPLTGSMIRQRSASDRSWAKKSCTVSGLRNASSVTLGSAGIADDVEDRRRDRARPARTRSRPGSGRPSPPPPGRTRRRRPGL